MTIPGQSNGARKAQRSPCAAETAESRRVRARASGVMVNLPKNVRCVVRESPTGRPSQALCGSMSQQTQRGLHGGPRGSHQMPVTESITSNLHFVAPANRVPLFFPSQAVTPGLIQSDRCPSHPAASIHWAVTGFFHASAASERCGPQLRLVAHGRRASPHPPPTDEALPGHLPRHGPLHCIGHAPAIHSEVHSAT